jgi:hypothetical protein
MIASRDEALRLAKAHFDRLRAATPPSQFGPPPELAIVEDLAAETWYGWIFSIQSVKHLKTKNPLDMLVGGIGTLVVLKTSGEVFGLGRSLPRSEALTQLEHRLGLTRVQNKTASGSETGM